MSGMGWQEGLHAVCQPRCARWSVSGIGCDGFLSTLPQSLLIKPCDVILPASQFHFVDPERAPHGMYMLLGPGASTAQSPDPYLSPSKGRMSPALHCLEAKLALPC